MVFLCSRSSKVKEQPRDTDAANPRRGREPISQDGAAARSSAKSAGKSERRSSLPEEKGPARHTVKPDTHKSKPQRSGSVPLTHVERHKQELRQRRLRELENYPFNSKKQSKKPKGLFARSRAAKTDVPHDEVVLANSFHYEHSDFGSDEPEDFLYYPSRNGSFAAVAPRTTGDRPLTCAALASTDATNSDSFGCSGDAAHSTTSSNLRRTPQRTSLQASVTATPPRTANTLVPDPKAQTPGPLPLRRSATPSQFGEEKGYYMYHRDDPQTKQRVKVKSNRPPQRSKSLDGARPSPIHMPRA